LSIDSELEQIKIEEQTWDAVGIPEETLYPHQCDCSDDKLELVQTRKKKGEYMREFECKACGAEVFESRKLDETDMA
jgi:hypothetical protein